MSKARELADVIGTQDTTENVLQGRKNLIINGAMQVAQRGTSTSVSNNNNEGYSTVDRWVANFVSGMGGAVTFEQADAPSGTEFSKAMKISCTTTATPDVTHAFELSHRIEGQDMQHFKYGTSEAKTITVSFWVYTNKTGDYGVSLRTYSGSSYDVNGQTFTIDAANTWQKIVVTFSGNTLDVIHDNNSLGALLDFYLSAGSTRASLPSSNIWQDYTTARIPNSITNFFDSTSNVFYLTGVQLEVGSVATPFEHRSYGEELALCQRYYYADSSTKYLCSYGTGASNGLVHVDLPVTMRALPSLSYTSGAGGSSYSSQANSTNTVSFYAANTSTAAPRITDLVCDAEL